MNLFLKLIYCLLFLGSEPLIALEPKVSEHSDPHKVSFIPLIASNSTDGSMAGLGLFYEYSPEEMVIQKSSIWGVATASKHSVYSTRLSFEQPNYGLRWYSFNTNFPTPLYESRGVVRNPIKVQCAKTLYRVGYAQKWIEDLETLFYVMTKRESTRIPESWTHSLALGAKTQFFSLEDWGFSPIGYQLRGELLGNNNFVEGTLEWRHYIPLQDSLVLGSQLKLGLGEGVIPHAYLFRVGGAELLRGYKRSRLEGEALLAAALELRYKVWQMISLVGFTDLAEVEIQRFNSPFYSTGLGIRIGLPPDYLQQIRADFGFGKEGLNFSMMFGQAF